MEDLRGYFLISASGPYRYLRIVDIILVTYMYTCTPCAAVCVRKVLVPPPPQSQAAHATADGFFFWQGAN